MEKNAGDDFSPKVKQMLAERVNFHCTVCDAPTLGPKTGTTDERFSVGNATHIKAAAKNGPRYDENQTPAERKSIENGVWPAPAAPHGPLITGNSDLDERPIQNSISSLPLPPCTTAKGIPSLAST